MVAFGTSESIRECTLTQGTSCRSTPCPSTPSHCGPPYSCAAAVRRSLHDGVLVEALGVGQRGPQPLPERRLARVPALLAISDREASQRPRWGHPREIG